MCVLNKFYISSLKKYTESCFTIHSLMHNVYIAQREQNAINFIIFIEIVADVKFTIKSVV